MAVDDRRTASFVSMSFIAFGLRSFSERALTKSVVHKSTPPTSRMTSRNGKFVYPANGERNKFDRNDNVPI